MTMTGVHGLGGLAAAFGVTWLLRTRNTGYPRELLGVVAVGFVIGQFLPDVDFILTVPVSAVDPQLGVALHRSFTHSFVMILPIALVGALLYTNRNRESGVLGLSIAGGMTVHVLQDIPFWFEPLAFFWPVFHLLEGAPHWFGIWEGTSPEETIGTVQALLSSYTPPETLHSILFSWEYGSIALFLGVLYLLSVRLGTNRAYRSRLKLYIGLFLVVFAIALALVPFFDHATHTAIIWGPSPILWLLVVWVTIQMRDTIAAFGSEGLAGVRTGR